MHIIVSLIVYLIVLGLIWLLVSQIPLPAPFDLIIKILFILLAVLAVADVLGLVHGHYLPVINL
jgi:hypothetical protein